MRESDDDGDDRGGYGRDQKPKITIKSTKPSGIAKTKND